MKRIILGILPLLLALSLQAQGVDYTKSDSMKAMGLLRDAGRLKDKSMGSYMVFLPVR